MKEALCCALGDWAPGCSSLGLSAPIHPAPASCVVPSLLEQGHREVTSLPHTQALSPPRPVFFSLGGETPQAGSSGGLCSSPSSPIR